MKHLTITRASIAPLAEAWRSMHDRWHSAAQGLLKEQLEVVKYKTEAGVLRYTIRPLDVELPFDKVFSWQCTLYKFTVIICDAHISIR